MNKFKFAIMGTGNIAHQFYDAVCRIPDCEVVAVASKSMKKAQTFADKYKGMTAYDSYRELLEKEQPDCVYISAVPSFHYELTMLCLEHGVPVLCEKAMFRTREEAEKVFAYAKEKNLFVMEAMWSRFLPANERAKQWIEEGRIGKVRHCEVSIGFLAPKDRENRYYNRALGGGTCLDILVYAYELTTFMIEEPIRDVQVSTIWGDTDVDLTTHVILRYKEALASLTTSFVAPMEEYMTIYGEQGVIRIPHPHYASEAFHYNEKRELMEHFKDTETENGFVYEIREVMECIQAGKYESAVVPHQCTLDCAELFDKVERTRNQR